MRAKKMPPGKKKKKHWLVYLVLLPVCMLVGWICGVLLSTGLNFSRGVLQTIVDGLWGVYAMMGLGSGSVLWLIVCMLLSSRVEGLEPGREYGEARFAEVSEILPKIAGDETTDKVLSQNLHITLDDKVSGYNASALIIGGSGSGKTFRYLVPNLLQGNSSFVIIDPKGTTLTDYGRYLLAHGYQVKVINITDPWHSDCFNPLLYIRSSADITRLVQDYQRATTPKNSTESDPFWSKSEAMLTGAIIMLMLIAYPDDCTMEKYLELLHMLKPPIKDQPPSELDNLFEQYKNQGRVIWTDEISGEPVVVSGQRAYEDYKAIMDSAEDTCRSVIISAQARWNLISNSPGLVKMLSGKETIDFRALGLGYQGHMQKTALFIVCSDIDKTYSSIVLWVLSSLYAELYTAARTMPDDRLPIPVQIYLDEFANTPQGDNVLQLISTARSRGISVNVIVQSMGQLAGLFKDEKENIQGTADALIYLGSQEPSVHKAIAEQLGRYTLNKQSHSSAHGTSGNSSTSTDVIGKELMAQDRVRLLPENKCLLLIRGCEPVIDDKYRTQESPLFLEAMQYGKYDYQERHMEVPEMFGALSEDEMAYVIDHQIPVIWFADGELDGVDHDYVADVDYDGCLNEAAMQIWMRLQSEQQAIMEEPGGGHPQTLKELVLSGGFSDAQIAEANAGLEAGLTEEQVLAYFRPEYSPERMRALRLLMLQPD